VRAIRHGNQCEKVNVHSHRPTFLGSKRKYFLQRMTENYSGLIVFVIWVLQFISASSFTCSLTKVKQSFYMAFNSIFGKIGRMASEEVILELVKKKCMPASSIVRPRCMSNNYQSN
jgi:hypothetical protein